MTSSNPSSVIKIYDNVNGLGQNEEKIELVSWHTNNNDSTQIISDDPNAIPTGPLTESEEGRIALLLSSASKNNVDRIVALLDLGLNVNVADYDKRTALHLAAAEGALSALTLLLSRGANANARDRFGHTPLDDAISHGFSDVAKLLQENGGIHGVGSIHEQALITACASGDEKKVKMLLDAGVNPNCADYDGRTPLHLAVAEQQVSMILLLLSYKASPTNEDRWGITPITEAQRLATRTGQDPLKHIFDEFVPHAEHSMFSPFSIFFLIFEAVMIILIGLFCRYDNGVDGSSTNVDPAASWDQIWQVYPLYQDVHVMIFIGFGFLMVFLRKNSYTSVGYTFLLGAFCIQWYQLTSGFWQCVFTGTFTYLPVNIKRLVQGDFCAGSILISFGVVLGKVGPFQMMIAALIEVIFYSLNEAIATYLGISDVGGTMVIHMFGAFFGMALSVVSTPSTAYGNPHNAAVYHSDTMAMIGTIFLWLFWPSFNGALAIGAIQQRSIVNTVFGLCGSCVTAFLMSHVLRRERKFNMVDIQNATLSGGVALGACCDMIINPGSAVAIGSIAGALSVFGYVVIQPFLESRIGLHDTCGVNNLHGMPSLVGGFAAVIASSRANVDDYGVRQLIAVFSPSIVGRSSNTQAAYQFAFMCITVGMGLVAGAVTGLIIKWSVFNPFQSADQMFVDSDNWEVPAVEIPYYFDHRGEISRGKGNAPLSAESSAITNEQAMELKARKEADEQKYKITLSRFASIDAQLSAMSKKQKELWQFYRNQDQSVRSPPQVPLPPYLMPNPYMQYPVPPYVPNFMAPISLPPAPAPAPSSVNGQTNSIAPNFSNVNNNSSNPTILQQTQITTPASSHAPSGSSHIQPASTSNLEKMMELLISKLDHSELKKKE